MRESASTDLRDPQGSNPLGPPGPELTPRQRRGRRDAGGADERLPHAETTVSTVITAIRTHPTNRPTAAVTRSSHGKRLKRYNNFNFKEVPFFSGFVTDGR